MGIIRYKPKKENIVKLEKFLKSEQKLIKDKNNKIKWLR